MVERVHNELVRSAVRETDRPVFGSEGTKLANKSEDAKTAAVRAPEQPERVKSAEPLDQVVVRINEYLQNVQRDLRFAVNEESGRVVVTVVNPETDEVIRQIPPEEVMAVAERLQQHQEGLFVSEQV